MLFWPFFLPLVAPFFLACIQWWDFLCVWDVVVLAFCFLLDFLVVAAAGSVRAKATASVQNNVTSFFISYDSSCEK
jgi:hypothetical protein